VFLKGDLLETLPVTEELGERRLILLQAPGPSAFPPVFEIHPDELAQHRRVQRVVGGREESRQVGPAGTGLCGFVGLDEVIQLGAVGEEGRLPHVSRPPERVRSASCGLPGGAVRPCASSTPPSARFPRRCNLQYGASPPTGGRWTGVLRRRQRPLPGR